MIDTKALKSKILDMALQGKITNQLESDGTAEELYKRIESEKLKLIKENKIKNQPTKPVDKGNVPYKIPASWKWVRIGSIEEINLGFTYRPEYVSEGKYFLSAKDISKGNIDFSEAKKVSQETYENAAYGSKPQKGDVLFCRVGTIGKPQVIYEDIEFCIFVSLGFFRDHVNVMCQEYVSYWMQSRLFEKQVDFQVKGALQRNLNTGWLKEFYFPLPPIKEQKRIVEVINSTMVAIDAIDKFQSEYSSNLEILKSKIIDAGIQGKLTEQLPEDEIAEILTDQFDDCINSEDKGLEIPDNWKWIRLGWAVEIERGGSPRPIKAFITQEEDGINWIKIGDVAKDGKYIEQTKEKIKPEGEKKSRKVFPGDFLLTNSMSYGRPYITKIEGCIHDGWLLLRNEKELFDLDYLYWLLSSKYVYDQFSKKASGATVENLNKDKVAAAVIPLPPISEQRRIARRIEEILSLY